MFLKCIKYKEGSFIAPLNKTINSSINTINNAIVPNETLCDNKVVGKPINAVNKPPIQTNAIKCSNDIPHSTTTNRNSSIMPHITGENSTIVPEILSKITAESDVSSPIIHVIPNNSSLPTEKESSPSKAIANSINKPITSNKKDTPTLRRNINQYTDTHSNLAENTSGKFAVKSPVLRNPPVDNFHNTFPNLLNNNSIFNDNNILKHSLPILSKSLYTENDTVLILFSCQINIMLAQYIRIFFMVKRYSSSGSPITLGSSHIFSAFGSNEKCKSFSFQLLDTELTPGKYTYSVEAYSNIFKVLPLGLIIINPHITLFTGNQF